jgi:hypothetical protein
MILEVSEMLYDEETAQATSARRLDAVRSGSRQPGLAVRLAARLRWFSLDERLIAGEDPSGSQLLSAHAAHLTSSRSREAVAAGLAALMRAAEQPSRVSRVSPHRSAVLANRQVLEELARRLESRAAVYAPGVARLERLVADSAGPAFAGGVKALEEELAHATAELGGAAPGRTAVRASSGGGSAQGVRRPDRLFRVGPRRFARLAGRGAPGPAIEPPGFIGGSFTLPDGSWFHGRRDSA